MASRMNWDKVKQHQKMQQPSLNPTNRTMPALKLASEKQLKYLNDLGYEGPMDLTANQASARIKELINKK